MRIGVGELRSRAQALWERLGACDICPRRCGADRLRGERGFCGAAATVPLSAAVAHHGEEPPVSGTGGAGNLFFGGCNLRCTYCQNHQISAFEIPMPEYDPAGIADQMLGLQDQGVHNIGWVTPTHLLPLLMVAWAIAWERGLRLPLIYNTGTYELPEVLRGLDGVVDVYLPDVKYADGEAATALSHAPDYWPIAQAALEEMVRQCGALACGDDGLVRRGVIVRHLVLPNELAGTEEILCYLAQLRPRPALSLLAQFHPEAGCDHPLLQRPVSEAEYARARRWADHYGPFEGWVQAPTAPSFYRPDFTRPEPFLR